MGEKQFLFFCRIFIVCALSFPIYIYGQNIDKAAQEVDRQSIKDQINKLTPAQKEPQKVPYQKHKQPQQPKGPAFYVKSIIFTGIESFPLESFSLIKTPYENRMVSLDELNELAKKIETEYLRRGVIAACFVPPQEIKNDIAQLSVIEARMGQLIVNDHKYFKKSRIYYYWLIKQNKVLSYSKISRSLQSMNKNPDRDVKATLSAGKDPGTTDVKLDVTTKFPLHLGASWDNEGIPSTGIHRSGLNVKYNNFLGFDDTLLGGVSFGPHFFSQYYYHKLPLTNTGMSLVSGYSYSKSFPKKDYDYYAIDSRAKNWTGSIHQDLFKGEDYFGEIYSGLDFKDKVTKTRDGLYNKDRLRIINTGASFIYKGSDWVTYFNPEFNQGINGFGAQRLNEYSSRGAKNVFSKFTTAITHKKRLFWDMIANFKTNTQITNHRLPPQEQMSLGGMDSVRGYPSGDYMADNGVQSTVELQIPAFFIPANLKFPKEKKSIKENTSLVCFYDFGYGTRRGKDPSENQSHSLSSVGPGLVIKACNAVIRMAWGFALRHNALSEQGDTRFHVSLEWEY